MNAILSGFPDCTIGEVLSEQNLPDGINFLGPVLVPDEISGQVEAGLQSGWSDTLPCLRVANSLFKRIPVPLTRRRKRLFERAWSHSQSQDITAVKIGHTLSKCPAEYPVRLCTSS